MNGKRGNPAKVQKGQKGRKLREGHGRLHGKEMGGNKRRWWE